MTCFTPPTFSNPTEFVNHLFSSFIKYERLMRQSNFLHVSSMRLKEIYANATRKYFDNFEEASEEMKNYVLFLRSEVDDVIARNVQIYERLDKQRKYIYQLCLNHNIQLDFFKGKYLATKKEIDGPDYISEYVQLDPVWWESIEIPKEFRKNNIEGYKLF